MPRKFLIRLSFVIKIKNKSHYKSEKEIQLGIARLINIIVKKITINLLIKRK